MEKNSTRVTLVLIALGAASRLLPHPPNVTPIAAMALLGGAGLKRWQAFLAPLAALFVSDAVIGFHGGMPFVYGCFLATAWMGTRLAEDRAALRVGTACLASSILFFVVTNFGTWLTSGMYPHTGAGLAACYTAAIPFFRYSVLGDFAFTGV